MTQTLPTLALVERVIFLRKVPLFADYAARFATDCRNR